MNARLRTGSWLALGLAMLFIAGAAETKTPAPPRDTPCKVHQRTAALYPVRMLHQGVTRGHVQLVAEIDPQGKARDVLLSAYTHRPFADAALAAFKEWHFEPGYVEGRPVTSILTVEFEFETNGVLTHETTFETRDLDRSGTTYEYRAHGIETLDRRPANPAGEEPIYPKAWIQEGRAGSIVVEFFIDESGRARLPALAGQGDDLLAASALAAVRTWRFEPPTHRGKPVLARASQLFVFEPPAKAGRAPGRG
jgi:TonB family protein